MSMEVVVEEEVAVVSGTINGKYQIIDWYNIYRF